MKTTNLPIDDLRGKIINNPPKTIEETINNSLDYMLGFGKNYKKLTKAQAIKKFEEQNLQYIKAFHKNDFQLERTIQENISFTPQEKQDKYWDELKNMFISMRNEKGINCEPKLPFGKTLDDSMFLKLVQEGVEYACYSNPKEILEYKIEILEDIGKYTKNIFSFQNIIKDIKKEGILSLIMADNIQDIEEGLDLIKVGFCTLSPLIKLEFNKNNNQYNLDKEELIKILTSNVLIEFYKENLTEFIPAFNYKIKDDEALREIICSYIKNNNIYFCDLPKNIMSITIFSGNIYLKASYLKEYFENTMDNIINQDDSIIIREKIVLNIKHELNHVLLRLIDDEKRDNFFLKSKNNTRKDTLLQFKNKFIGKSHELSCNESGNCFDYKFYMGYYFNNLLNHEANFFLDVKNMNDRKEYENKFKIMINKKNEYKKPTSSINKFKKMDDEYSGCFRAVSRQKNTK